MSFDIQTSIFGQTCTEANEDSVTPIQKKEQQSAHVTEPVLA